MFGTNGQRSTRWATSSRRRTCRPRARSTERADKGPMPITYDGNLIATGMRFGIVVSRWNSIITERMLEGALDGLYRHGADPDSIEVARVPGTWEIPVIARKMANAGRFDAVISIGCLIRGETPHFDYLSSSV